MKGSISFGAGRDSSAIVDTGAVGVVRAGTESIGFGATGADAVAGVTGGAACVGVGIEGTDGCGITESGGMTFGAGSSLVFGASRSSSETTCIAPCVTGCLVSFCGGSSDFSKGAAPCAGIGSLYASPRPVVPV